MTRLLIVGTGASGVHFAQTALDAGHHVTMIDVGYAPPDPVAPAATFDELKSTLDDPVTYFLGADGRNVVLPDASGKLYGFPPTKDYVFRHPRGFRWQGRGFDAVFSFARGGLAEAWSAGVYELGPADLEHFPFPAADLQAGYDEVSRRIGITGAADDLARFSPFTAAYQAPLDLDARGARLAAVYERRKRALNARQGFYLGRSRLAMLGADDGDRSGCGLLGRCLWGCPQGSIYAPSQTLAQLTGRPGFEYLPGRFVTHFAYDTEGAVTGIHARPVDGGEAEVHTADAYVLAAGALCSSKIYLDSILRATDRAETLAGITDNGLAHVPFIMPRMIGRPVNTESFQFHQLAFGLDGPTPDAAVHGQITMLQAAPAHPIMQNMPAGLQSAADVFRIARSGLGLATVWVHAQRRKANTVTVRPDGNGGTELMIRHESAHEEELALRRAVRRAQRGLRALGAIAVPGMTRFLPKGAGIHYAGTLPMSSNGNGDGNTVTPDGRSRRFPNLLVIDGASFPFVSAKNITFSLMANAVRVARAFA